MPPSPDIQRDLRAAYSTGNLVVFVGAGVPAAAGLDDWPRLAKRLRRRLQSEGKPQQVLAEVGDLIRKGQLVDALSAAKLALGEHEFNLAVENAVDDSKLVVPDVAAAIAELRPKLRAVITTNLDSIMERAFLGAWPTLTAPTGDLAQRREYILKLHGTRLDRSTWVFTRDQYDQATFGRPQHRAIFEAIFRAYPILFVGYGLIDDDLEQTLGATRALAGGQPPQHFALLRDPLPPHRRKKLDDAGVRLLVYDNHTDVPVLLRAIR
ncbi:SIR2 family protein [Sorangium sp. So ce295]|uniref:SIR2 family NAD-dependent protein deacylase n=1 Tax=Sorangium sp. So ce295 TaxID=3133295 RepID=UPI003F615CCF